MAKKKRKKKLRKSEVRRRASRRAIEKRNKKTSGKPITIKPSTVSTSSGIGVMKTKVVDPDDPEFYPDSMKEMATDMLGKKEEK